MSTWTPQAKSADISKRWDAGNWDAPNALWDANAIQNVQKSVSIWQTSLKAGAGWLYNQDNLTYDALIDSRNGLPVYYDSDGVLPVWTALPKNP